MKQGTLRKAVIKDVEAILALLSPQSQEGRILPLTRFDLYSRLRDYFLYEDPQGRLLGVCGLHICWEDLGEVRSLVVAEEVRGQRLGRLLVEACLEEARQLGLRKVFALTYRAEFFVRLGFREVDKNTLPHKIWMDCVHCAKFPQCDEVAVAREV
jgi:amino-acid N-acetyltransferase